MARAPATLPEVARRLAEEAGALRFAPPVVHVLHPLVHAWAPHARYLERWGRGPKEALLLGMNPGPFGMAQTGVPFGEVAAVRDYLGCEGPVERPAREHPARPVLGFACPRSEVSGRRLWGWVRERFGPPERFFARFFVANYCPLAFLEASGANRTPDKLPAGEREALFAVCDRALRDTVRLLGVRTVLGVGVFARDRAAAVLGPAGPAVHLLPHPSPASPAANRGWAALADRALADAGLAPPPCA